MRAYPIKIAITAAGMMARFVKPDTSLLGGVFVEAAFLRVQRTK